jgi:hypothetical protein
LTVENKYKSLVARLCESDWSGMRWMPCLSSQSVELRLVWTEQLSTEITSRFSCDALLQGKIIYSRKISIFVTK